MKFYKQILLVSFFSILFYTCKKDNNDNNVPNVLVDIFIYANQPSFIDVSVVGGWTYVTGGVRGILLYRKTTTEFMAYERNCTYDPSEACATVFVDGTNILASDTCCGSTFSIYDGTITQGPAGLPLKVYNTTFDLKLAPFSKTITR